MAGAGTDAGSLGFSPTKRGAAVRAARQAAAAGLDVCVETVRAKVSTGQSAGTLCM